MKSYIVVLLVASFFASCSDKNGWNYKEIEVKTSDNIMATLITENDTVDGIETYSVSIDNDQPMRKFYFYRRGGIMSVYIYLSDSTWISRRYYRSGGLKSVTYEKLFPDKSMPIIFNGNRITYYENGNVKMSSKWKDGTPIDTHQFFCYSGLVYRTKIYNSNGSLMQEIVRDTLAIDTVSTIGHK